MTLSWQHAMTGRHLGYLVARDLGDGRLELWEADRDRAAPLRPTARECREEMARAGADPDTWHVIALVDLDGGGGAT